MIKVLFFARIRDQVGCSELELSLPEGVSNLGELTALVKRQGDTFEAALSDQQLLVAVNQEMANPAMTIEDGDEIAYFPPVTGG
ncbi:molybdopterin converting factor subunit 1 [Ketobacter sp. MCCC 1A13808]|uniref:molybdopterin converting factor subunit 1 n=1 Tax=Ketobacter sp. MCCC 1A13808 TaxID=2602738 RepID=UPI0012EC1D4A|nr:molybdopterin converting factor subunit 1 [Ketobacter sp. MCCC 1A13808]MVF10597.1 molybdopterin converting factor subunit 1 [Ketobacter sp. MCCC 1A13808]